MAIKKNIIFRFITQNSILDSCCKVPLGWMPENIANEKSIFVQVMTAPVSSKPLPQLWPISMGYMASLGHYGLSQVTLTHLQIKHPKISSPGGFIFKWVSETPLSHCGHMVTQIWVNIGSDNGLLPDDTKPLPEPMLTNHQWGVMAFTWGQYHRKCPRYLSLSLKITNQWLQPHLFRGQWVKDSTLGK